jgi:polysaccharide biosynthesis/export protein
MKIKMIRVLALLVLSLGLLGTAVAQNQIVAAAAKQPETATSDSSPAKTFSDRYPRYKLQTGDSFDLNFELNPEFNQTLTVQPDGFVTLRGIGDLQVKDLTVPELTEKLRSAYGRILNDPLITIILKDFEKAYFIADGQVGKPGKYDLRGDTTLTQAIAMAGGFTESSKHSQVLLFRKASEGWYSAKIFNVKKMENTGNLQEDPQLRPGDMLFVPKNKYSKIKAFLPSSSVGTFSQIRPN